MKMKNLWNKRLDLIFVYLFIFLCGVAIIMAMTSYLNDKVQEFTETTMLQNID